ncbi:MAG TPA: chain length-determining protein [Candidatus Competibacter sp.]|nr:chain length-determining protein [Candidatus Competibacteraceae bacterium]HRC73522.1 chain length-determining protein [Candidatus Competibacter sp.]
MNDLVEQVLSYLRGIWRKRWYAMALAWLVCVIGWIGVLKLPDQYEVSAKAFVDTQTILRPLLQGLTVEVNPDTQVGLIMKTLLTRPNLEQIAHKAGLDNQIQDLEAKERWLDKLQNKINLVGSGREKENLYTITYEDRDPQFAKRVVESALAVFESNLVGGNQQDSAAAQRFLDEQIADYEVRLLEAEDRLKAFKLKNAGLMPSEGQNYNARLQQYAGDLSTGRLELSQAENRRNSLQQQIAQALQQQLRGDGEVVALPIDQRIQSLEQNLDELLIKFTAKHPDVNILKQTIADLKKQREQERLRYAASLAESGNGGSRAQNVNTVYQQLKVRLAEEEANVASLRVRVDEYQRRYRELQSQVSVLPQIEAELAALNRDYEGTRKKYDELVSRRESVKLSQEAERSKQEIRFKILDPPRAPLKPTGPNRLLLMTAVLGAGLAAGIGLAFLVAQLWPTFDSRFSLKQIADIPVFGSVSAVLPPAVVSRERRMAIVYVGLVGVLVLVYAGLIVVDRVGFQ